MMGAGGQPFSCNLQLLPQPVGPQQFYAATGPPTQYQSPLQQHQGYYQPVAQQLPPLQQSAPPPQQQLMLQPAQPSPERRPSNDTDFER